jgi:hypothetical protein
VAQKKIITGKDIINGLCVVGGGSFGNAPATYDNPQRTQHFASGDSLKFFQEMDGRYRYHGGVGGSGNWEH